MDKDIETIIDGDEEAAAKALESFIETAAQIFTFPELDHNNKRANLWNALLKLASSSNDPKTLTNCFAAIRILSREKRALNELISADWFDLVKKHSGLGNDALDFDESKTTVAIEVLKSLCNLVFNSSVAAAMCCQNGILENLAKRLKTKDRTVPEEVRFFDVKLVFLLTALCSETRNKVKDDMDGVTSLIELLDWILREAANNCLPNSICLNDQQVDLVCEILKALFNLTLKYGSGPDEEAQCAHLVTTLRIFLLIPTNSKEKSFMLKNNIVNLLTSMPNKFYKNLITPAQPNQHLSDKVQFEGQNMTAFYEILQFVQEKFSDEPTVSKQHEILSPVISVLLKCACTERSIRKYLRAQILPPLTDVHNRPEQGTTLRNCLCRLLTTPITQLRDLTAEFLFVLCKNNVKRMIKYTGYGNAAGLFAQRGLLGGRSDEGEAFYSSDSEDSETEEYAEHKHAINPVTGCYEAPHPSAMENMTEEQKEYEAMKLVELMDNLTKCGAIKPCRVGPDGKPQPIEHVLQLQEGLRSQQVKRDGDNNSESE